MIKHSANIDPKKQRLLIVLSADTEFDPPPNDGTWWDRPSAGFIDGLPRFQEICDQYRAPATFFCEGKLVEQFPDLFKELAHRHEIGCHSYNHEWLGARPPPKWIPCRNDFSVLSLSEKKRVVRRGIGAIEKAIGKTPRSFKAPFNSVDHPSTLMLLDELGFVADSSLPSFNNETFVHPLRPAPTRHASRENVWEQGNLRMLEIPFTIRSRPLLLHPFDVREEVMDTVGRGMDLALESVILQSKLDALAERYGSLLHITSHPWAFSHLNISGEDGKVNSQRLIKYLDLLTSEFDVDFLTVRDFAETWERYNCSSHSGTRRRRERL
jgi:peptidoglycan/xylan/chitin deacetylase (PgdA/CDA1 family)